MTGSAMVMMMMMVPCNAGADESAEGIAARLGVPLTSGARQVGSDLLLVSSDDVLELRDGREPAQRGARADFAWLDTRPGSRGLSKRQPLARAIGRRSRTVVDAAAGLGGDAVLLALLGFDVTAIERSPVAAALLADGLRRAVAQPRLASAIGGRIELHLGDARDVLPTLDPRPDVVYLDPMFPPRAKRSALARKPVRLLRRLVGDDRDADELLTVALRHARCRVVVKRHRRAEPITAQGAAPWYSCGGKLVRYDVYAPADDRVVGAS